MGEFTHFDHAGRAVMVDVSEKDITERMAVAKGRIRVSREVFDKIREGTMKKGDVLGIARTAGIMAAKRTFELINNLDAAKYFKASTDREACPDLVPRADANGFPLKYTLKTGTMVLFYENSPAELYDCSRRELAKRLYKVTAMAAEGRVQFLFHQEARDQKTITSLYGAGASRFRSSEPSPKLRLSVSSFNMLVEGYDFELTVTGEIKFKRELPC